MADKELEIKKDNNKQPSIKINVILNVLYQFLIIIIPLVTTPYLSRVLLENGVGAKVGISSYTSSLVSFFIIFAVLGTCSYGTREIARKRDSKEEYSKLFYEIETLSIFTSLITLVFWIVFSSFYVEYRIYLYILSLNILAICFDIGWLYSGLEKYQYTVSINAFFKIISAALIFIFVNNPNDLWKYILISSSAVFLGNLSMWIFLPKIITKGKLSVNNLKYHLKNSFKYFIPTIATTIYTTLDKTLIGLLIPGYIDEEQTIKVADVENGYYEQATKTLTMVKSICFLAINNVMYSRASALFEKQEFDKIKSYLDKTLHLTLNLSIGAMFGIIIVAGVFVPLYFGPGYEKATIILYVLSAIVPIICISNTLGSIYYVPFGKRKQSSYYLVMGSIINLLLNIPLIIFFKSVGAAISSIVAELVITLLYIIKSERYLTFKELFFILWKKIVAGLIMFGSLYGIGILLNTYLENSLIIEIIKFMILFASGVVIYEFTLLLLRDKSIQNIKEWIPFIRRKNEH